MVTVLTLITSLHSGRTDGNGGHYNRSTGEYHYHHGHPAHDHYDIDGDGVADCPYTFEKNTTNNSKKQNNVIWGIIGATLFLFLPIYGGLCFFMIEGEVTDYIERWIKKITHKDWTKSASDRFWKTLFIVVGIIIEICFIHDYLS